MSIIQSKTVNLYQKFVDFTENWSNLIENDDFRLKFVQFLVKSTFFRTVLKFKIEISVRIRIENVATIDQTAGIESQKSVKSGFDHD